MHLLMGGWTVRVCRTHGSALAADVEVPAPKIDAASESHFGSPDCQTLFDPIFCVLKLQNLNTTKCCVEEATKHINCGSPNVR